MAHQVQDTPTLQRTVLIVEDDAVVRGLVVTLLDEAGYKAVTLSDHRLIPEAVERWKPSAVLIDGELDAAGSRLSWADALAIRRRHPSLPVLLFTGDDATIAEARSGTSSRSRAAGFAGVVRKPFVVEEFLATLANVVTTPHPASARETPALPFPDRRRAVSVPAAEWGEAELFGAAVHELRTPLTTISGQLQRARRLMLSDPARASEAVQRALAQVDRMNRLMSDVLLHARLQTNALTLTKADLDIAQLIAESIAQYDDAVKPRISFDRPAAPVRIRADGDRIQQILANLLDNALKYSAADAPVEVWLRVVGADAQIRVADHGVGVPEDERDKLFAPYYRSSRTVDVTGTGLGLHISRRLAERHDGRLVLETTGTDGSVFTLTLPLASPGDDVAAALTL